MRDEMLSMECAIWMLGSAKPGGAHVDGTCPGPGGALLCAFPTHRASEMADGVKFPGFSRLGLVIFRRAVRKEGVISSSQLTQEQKDSLHAQAAEGATLPDLQRHLKEAFGISATYMDMRFMVLDLGIELVQPKVDEPADAKSEDAVQEMPAPPVDGGVSVTVDSITLPGTLVSGKVTFSDGETGIWMIDQAGRPGLDPDTPGYRPSQEDVMEFQTKLRALLESGRY